MFQIRDIYTGKCSKLNFLKFKNFALLYIFKPLIFIKNPLGDNLEILSFMYLQILGYKYVIFFKETLFQNLLLYKIAGTEGRVGSPCKPVFCECLVFRYRTLEGVSVLSPHVLFVLQPFLSAELGDVLTRMDCSPAPYCLENNFLLFKN